MEDENINDMCYECRNYIINDDTGQGCMGCKGGCIEFLPVISN